MTTANVAYYYDLGAAISGISIAVKGRGQTIITKTTNGAGIAGPFMMYPGAITITRSKTGYIFMNPVTDTVTAS